MAKLDKKQKLYRAFHAGGITARELVGGLIDLGITDIRHELMQEYGQPDTVDSIISDGGMAPTFGALHDAEKASKGV